MLLLLLLLIYQEEMLMLDSLIFNPFFCISFIITISPPVVFEGVVVDPTPPLGNNASTNTPIAIPNRELAFITIVMSKLKLL